jgi:hypothetical protein
MFAPLNRLGLRAAMKRNWESEELIGCWTLGEHDWRLLRNKTGPTRLGFALLLKYFELEARFPRHAGDVPRAAVDYIAQQVSVDPAEFARYDWPTRSGSASCLNRQAQPSASATTVSPSTSPALQVDPGRITNPFRARSVSLSADAVRNFLPEGRNPLD